jgi:hypothetical protein
MNAAYCIGEQNKKNNYLQQHKQLHFQQHSARIDGEAIVRPKLPRAARNLFFLFEFKLWD